MIRSVARAWADGGARTLWRRFLDERVDLLAGSGSSPPPWRDPTRLPALGSTGVETPQVLNLFDGEVRAIGGGVPLQLTQRLRHEARSRQVLLLSTCRRRSSGAFELRMLSTEGGYSRYRLDESWSHRQRSGRERADGRDPWLQVLAALAQRCDIGLVHLEGLGQTHPGTWLLRMQSLGLPWVVSVHDFHLFCPRHHLYERPTGRYCQFTQEEDRCARCVSAHPRVVSLEGEPQSIVEWRRAARALLAGARRVVAPSGWVAERFADLWPDIQDARVIEPGASSGDLDQASGERLHRGSSTSSSTADRRLRVAFVGKPQDHKGAPLFAEIAGLDRARDPRRYDWHALGGGDSAGREVLRRNGVETWGYYRAGHLGRELRRRKIDLVLLVSRVPESYGLTLDECVHAGVPVVASSAGALSERVRRCDAGRVVALEAEPREILLTIDDMVSHEGTLRDPASRTSPLPDPGPLSSPEAAAELYLDLYRQESVA